MTRRVVVAMLLTGAVVCGALATLPAGGGPDPAPRPPAVATAAWSARRVPQPFVDAVGSARLQRRLDAAFGSGEGCFDVLTAATTVAARQADVPYIGASTQKLLTGAGALAVLGSDTKLTTRVLATGGVDDGTVDRMMLVGGGDPLLSTEEFRAALESDPKTAGTPSTPLESLADAVVADGVRKVGALVVVDDRYDDERYNPAWPASYRTQGQIGPVGALTVNKGFSRLKPVPVPVEDPAVAAGDAFTRLLRARGVSVGGTVQRGKVPDGAIPLAAVESAPMKDVVAEVVRSSDNLAAEMLVKEIGVRAAKEGTTSAGLAAATKRLGEMGVTMTGVTLVDGSGLGRDNRVTCRALADTVDLGARPDMVALWAGMSVAGQTGTLADELLGSGLEGRLRAKTGFLNGVTGLAGVVDNGRPLRFSFIVNGGFGETEAIRIRAALAQIIARFPEAPAPDALVPAPVAPAGAPASTSPAP
ncbi:MAG: D-alanyl-D-alanine carboxypeptidase/D-alanyl-D-alanine-endopeptidase [Actinomycetota bacterium]